MPVTYQWNRIPEHYFSTIGKISKSDETGEWECWVFVEGKKYKLTETYVSLEVAKGVVERTWKREMERLENGRKEARNDTTKR